jgi:hypothetical protein
MFIISFDIKGILHKEFVLVCQTVPHITVTFYGNRVKRWEDLTPKFGDKEMAVAAQQCTISIPGNFLPQI